MCRHHWVLYKSSHGIFTQLYTKFSHLNGLNCLLVWTSLDGYLHLWVADLSSSLFMFSSSKSNFVSSGNRKGKETQKRYWCLTEDFKLSKPEEVVLTHKDIQEGGRFLPLETRVKNWKARECYWVEKRSPAEDFFRSKAAISRGWSAGMGRNTSIRYISAHSWE